MESLQDITRAIQKRLETAQETAAVALEVREHVMKLTGHAESAGGEVEAMVDHHRLITDLELTQDAMRLEPEELENLIVATVRSAVTDVSVKIQEAQKPLLERRPEEFDENALSDAFERLLG